MTGDGLRIRDRRGNDLGHAAEAFDRGRPLAGKPFRSLCYAPFLAMSFAHAGLVKMCPHSLGALGHVPDASLGEMWESDWLRRARDEFRDYRIEQTTCPRCFPQIRAGNFATSFARGHFDAFTPDPGPSFAPRYLFFSMANTCNHACIMCNSEWSSRHWRARKKAPLPPDPYDDRFFAELATLLPRVERADFYGGEPFLVAPQLRAMDLMADLGCEARVMVNTNGSVLTLRVKRYFDRLRFAALSISLDGITPETLEAVRVGARFDLLMDNLAWFARTCRAKNIYLTLNVTEQRKNWTELPDLYRLAALLDCRLHATTCISPPECSLYTLPTPELRFVFRALSVARDELDDVLAVRDNRSSLDHVLRMMAHELEAREAGRGEFPIFPAEIAHGRDGRLALPGREAPPPREDPAIHASA
jgi:MoaA/NifB/PqqE/SkfB family radical SAM enzyme